MTALRRGPRAKLRRPVGWCPYCRCYLWSMKSFTKHHAWGHAPTDEFHWGKSLNPGVSGEGDST